MKIRELLTEHSTDVVARFYKESGPDFDKFYNPEDAKYKEKTQEYYNTYLKSWFTDNIITVFNKPVNKPQPEFTNKPKQGKLQSPGYRGLQYALAAAGLPYDQSVQRYEPNLSKMVAPQTMDGARNNNGQ